MAFLPKISPVTTAAILAAAALAGSGAVNAIAAPQSGASSQTMTNAQTNGISYCQAGKTATAKFGGTVESVSSDHYRGASVWEVELRNSQRGNIEVKISKASGKILHVKKD